MVGSTDSIELNSFHVHNSHAKRWDNKTLKL